MVLYALPSMSVIVQVAGPEGGLPLGDSGSSPHDVTNIRDIINETKTLCFNTRNSFLAASPYSAYSFMMNGLGKAEIAVREEETKCTLRAKVIMPEFPQYRKWKTNAFCISTFIVSRIRPLVQ
jgi:hypothetical protein